MTVERAILVVLLVVAACGGGGTDDELTGEALATEVGCLACHTGSDTNLAPTLEGIWGTEEQLDDDRTVTVDEVYVRKSITDPTADVVAGFRPVMPRLPLDESEIDRLVEWVESLG